MNSPNNTGYNIRKRIEDIELKTSIKEAGRVVWLGDGIAKVTGLRNAISGEFLKFENGVGGIALNLEQDEIGVVILGSEVGIAAGELVTRTGQVVKVPVGDQLLGRVVNATGQPIDGEGVIVTNTFRPIEVVAPGVIARSAVNQPLETGIKAIDAMVPIGKGQRQLIIGDRQTGKTSIAVDTIINQKGKNVNCIYVAIGQKTSTVASIINILEEYDAMKYTTIVCANAAEAASLQYIAPYSGCAIGEEWMQKGQDVLIIFDDLSKHAVAYRTMSLLLRRPPGREAYPGDVFYLHSRLLERAGKLSKEYGSGSMTALPIVETQGGDMSAYIPTNVISITDGQIYLETNAFNSGIRPAINPGLSVSRVGGAAQIKAMRNIAGPVRTQLAQYKELEAFSQFSSDLDSDTRKRLDQGRRIMEILKQPLYKPLPIEQQVIILFGITKGFFDKIPPESMHNLENEMIEHFKTWHVELLNEIRDKEEITPELDAELSDAISKFTSEYRF